VFYFYMDLRSNLQCYCRNKQADKKTENSSMERDKSNKKDRHNHRLPYMKYILAQKRQTPASTVIRQLYASFQPTVQLTTEQHINDKKKLHHKSRSYAARPGSIQKASLMIRDAKHINNINVTPISIQTTIIPLG
jgi:hypothetical protein